MCRKCHKKGHMARVCKSKGFIKRNKASWVDVGEEDEDIGKCSQVIVMT